MMTAVLTLSAAGLARARLLRQEIGDGVTIYGPSCVVGRCGGTSGSLGALETDEPGLMGWAGPLRGLVDRLWTETDAMVLIMPMDHLVRLVGLPATSRREGPAVVGMDEQGRMIVGVLRGSRSEVNPLVDRIARVTGGIALPLNRVAPAPD